MSEAVRESIEGVVRVWPGVDEYGEREWVVTVEKEDGTVLLSEGYRFRYQAEEKAGQVRALLVETVSGGRELVTA